ncbi:MAG: hypothetical protein K2I36_01635 [Ureaplasma sp.]|nr:hypothetical protein [Ureaplasma sp.]MDE7221746.1 hypothetical protein [Ureaplasma sp.]
MHLISEQSAIDLSMIMYESIISRDAIPLAYEDIAEKIVLDKNNFIYQKIKENNLESKLNNQVKYAIYESYLEELNNTENIITNRCGNFFTKHFWMATWLRIQASILIVFTISWWAIQITPAIIQLAKCDITGFIGFEWELPKIIVDWARPLIYSIITSIQKFKKTTNCNWKFKVWIDSLNNPIII